MHSLMRLFLDQLTARLVPIVTSLIATSLESLRSRLVAESQADLEKAAREYESLGMEDVATTLRSRITELGTDDPCRVGVRLLENVGRGAADDFTPHVDEPSKPRLVSTAAAPEKPRRKASQATRSQEDLRDLDP